MARFRSMKYLAFATGAFISACDGATTLPVPNDLAVPLFEVESQNYAWEPYWAGFYVDGNGNVYAWNRGGETSNALAGDVLTPEQLAQKYAANRSLVKTLAADEVVQRYQLAGAAAQVALTEQNACADAGATRFSAWVLDAGDGKYHRIVLHQRGDLARNRDSAAARTIWKWLDANVLGTADPVGCDPFAD